MKKKERYNEAVKSTIKDLYRETLWLKAYMLFCRMMEKVWGWYHLRILHKGKFGFKEWLCNCHHINPWNRAYNRLKDATK